MKLRNFLVIILSIAMLGLADHADAQRRNKYKKRRKNNKKLSSYKGSSRSSGKFEPFLFAGGQINTGNYFGDLAPVSRAGSADISLTRPGFGLSAGYQFHSSVAVVADLNWVRVFGDDFSADLGAEESFARYARNLSFRNDIKEFRLAFQFFFLPNSGGPRRLPPINAYISLGAAVFHHSPMGKVPDADYQSALDGSVPAPTEGWVPLRPLGTEGQNLGIGSPYGEFEFSVPVAIGAQLKLPGLPFIAGAEFGIRYLFTDYIDDVSGNYVDLDRFDDPLARIMSDRSTVPSSSLGESRDLTNLRLINNSGAHDFFIEGNVGSGVDGTQRGNPDNNDLIFITQFKLSYIIGGTNRRRAKYR
ncbi:MAG: hypothetical protein HRT61_10945 [Ekhidna sp.]|nr:hypothetical protein [Ekhidna sp.]